MPGHMIGFLFSVGILISDSDRSERRVVSTHFFEMRCSSLDGWIGVVQFGHLCRTLLFPSLSRLQILFDF